MRQTEMKAQQFTGRYIAESPLWDEVELGLIAVGERSLIAGLCFEAEADFDWTSGFGAVSDTGLLTLHMQSTRGYKFELQHFASGTELWYGLPVNRLVLGRIGSPLDLVGPNKLAANELAEFLADSILHFERLDDDAEAVMPPGDYRMPDAYED